MRSVNSQNRFITSGVVGLAVLAALYVVLFTGDDVVEEGHDDNVVDVHEAWVRATAADGEEADVEGVTSAAYMEIGNHGDSDRRLVSVTADGIGMIQIHQTVVEDDIARMEHQADGLLIPAGKTIVLEPMGLHLMLMNLGTSLVDGETLKLKLHFDDDSTLEVDAPIRDE